MMRFKREGFVPSREMILVFSGDEETDMASTRERAKRFHHAEFLLNADAGGGTFDDQLKPVDYEIQAAEKTYVDFELTVTSPGGHSSEPTADNAIYRLAKALDHVAAYAFPVQHDEITLASLHAVGKHGSGPLAKAMLDFSANPNDAKAATRSTRCRSAPRPTSTAASSPASASNRCRRHWKRSSTIRA
jgi:acetylornithine deacetylase/succinyl-diaminopimelate desuccinylase-like protein